MRDHYYREEWPDDLIERLDKNPRWKSYFSHVVCAGETVQTVMLKNWSACHGGLLTALKLVSWFEGKSPYGATSSGNEYDDIRTALWGLEHAMHCAEEDLDDIIYFIEATKGHPHPCDSGEEEEGANAANAQATELDSEGSGEEESPSNVISLTPAS